MSIETERDWIGLTAVGRVVAETLRVTREAVRPGMTGFDLDEMARRIFARYGAVSAPKEHLGFPGTILISVNDAAVHGVPDDTAFQEGDLVSIDVTAELNGYVADAAVTVALPGSSDEARRLVKSAETAFERACRVAQAGQPIYRIGDAIEKDVEDAKFRVLRELYSHGVGRAIHEHPTIPNYRNRVACQRLTEGLVITIEPIISTRTRRTIEDPDGWTIRTRDGSLSSHYEHTVVITRGKPIILTAA
ncbi:MAG: type I methionyl aminopeptidase [Candidatus Poribacteria bacterium]|nr:type I methionyl aminopeptidase [Candidatus Poribacteria bacterium]